MTERLTNKPVFQFLDELASSAPAPGGGSVAALGGALGAALVSMVCNLTVGKKKYVDVEKDIKDILEKSEGLRHRLVDLLQEDVEAYTAVSQAMKMPRATDDEKSARRDAMQKALKRATEVPLQVAGACVEVIALCQPAAEKGNKNAVSDAGVAILMAEAGLRSAALNVLINLGWIDDQSFTAQKQRELDDLLAGKPALRDQVYDYVVEKL
jgi:formiminotetrahydrofolate cyclodeaminase